MYRDESYAVPVSHIAPSHSLTTTALPNIHPTPRVPCSIACLSLPKQETNKALLPTLFSLQLTVPHRQTGNQQHILPTPPPPFPLAVHAHFERPQLLRRRDLKYRRPSPQSAAFLFPSPLRNIHQCRGKPSLMEQRITGTHLVSNELPS